MKLTSTNLPRLQFHPNAYRFVFEGLQFTQEKLSKPVSRTDDDDSAHISGPELVEGLRHFGLKRFGFMTRTVFASWGIHCTGDFGKLVYELIERGEMRKTESDQLEDFFDIYDFKTAFEDDYEFSTLDAFEE